MKKMMILLLLIFNVFLIGPITSASEHIDFEEIFNQHTSVMLIVHPITGEIYYANQAAAEFYGYSLEVLIEMNISQINTLTLEEVEANRLKAIEEERNYIVLEHRLSNGDIKTVYVYSYFVIINTETYIVFTIIDQTDHLILENRERNLGLVLIGFLIIGIVSSGISVVFITIKNKHLKESEQRFEALHNASFGGIAVHDQGIILETNQGLSEMTGYTKEELIGMNGLLLIEPSQRDFVISQIKRGIEHPYESQGFHKSGETYPVRIEARNIPYKGKNVRVTEFRDITEIRKQEKERSRLESQWWMLIKELPLGFNIRELIFDGNGKPVDYKFLVINDMYESITGLKSENIIGKTAREVLPGIENSWIEKYAEVILTGKTATIEDYSGALGKYFRVIAYPYMENQFIILADDITERKTLEKEILNNEAQKSRIISNLPGVSYKCKFDDSWTMLFMSDVCESLTGYTSSELIGNSTISFNDLIMPSYRVYLKDQWVKSRELNRPCNVEYELMKKDGSIIWIWEQGVMFFEEDQWFIEGFLMDITDRKLSEEKIVYASKHDFLTGLPNRRFFDEKIIEIDQPKNYPIVISMIDIDGLKVINDTFGRHVGDEIILIISQILCLKFCKHAFVARIGGDEFIVVSTKMDIFEFKRMRNEVIEQVSTQKILDIPISLSFGIAIKSNETESINDLIIKAENDMYSKKVLHNESSRNQVITALFDSLKEKYKEERVHSDRVSRYCFSMGEILKLTKNDVLELEIAGRMHDIGKITIPDSILKNPGKLSEVEWDIMKSHTTNGYQIMRSADKYSKLADYALTHHERWDGKGYPKGLKEEEIPLFSRIICICDSFEAMTSDRPYRKALPVKDAVEELLRCSGSQFDPYLVELFVKKVIADNYSKHENPKES
ncbi:MAG: PAS domain S-box protein [bacterium]|nr:PAS domain S-box protein [bacterium]